MRYLTTKTIAIASLLLTVGCDAETGSHIGNPLAQVSFELRAVDDSGNNETIVFSDEAGTEYELTEARANFREIELDLPSDIACTDIEESLAGGAECKSDGGGHTILIDGPFVVDLLTGQSTPSLAAIRLPAITYTRIDFRIDDADPEDGVIESDDELADVSLVASADFSYMDEDLTLNLVLKFNEDVRVESEEGITVPDGGVLEVLLDTGLWLDDVPIGECLDDDDLEVVDGVLSIDENTSGGGDCSDIEDTIKDNIKNSADLD